MMFGIYQKCSERIIAQKSQERNPEVGVRNAECGRSRRSEDDHDDFELVLVYPRF
jgi:hypothetical protein